MKLLILLLASALTSMGFAQVSEVAKKELGLCEDIQCESSSALSSLVLPSIDFASRDAEAGDANLVPKPSAFYQSDSSGSSLCDSGGTFTMRRYLRESLTDFASNCGWQLVWKARRGNKSLDWKIGLPYSVSYENFSDALQKLLTPYKGVLGADIYVDVNVIVIEVNEDR